MLKITGSEDFYPTPESLLDRITIGVDWELINSVLEPSAGRGNISEYVKKKCGVYKHYDRYREIEMDIDCIEIEPELRAILKDKGFRVVHDDFLTYHTYKHYDLILMNPPFSVGARHLLKAIEIQQTSGGGIICLLNAETLRNPYSNERKDLLQKLEHYGAEIKYYENAFIDAERPTDVEVACVKVIIPEPERKTTIFESLREKEYEEYERKARNSELAESDLVSAIVAQYNREIEWGLRLYDEFLELRDKSLDEKTPISITLPHSEYDQHPEKFSVNSYVRAVRKKYWDKFFREPRFIGRLTSNLLDKYRSQVNTFVEYDFSYWNVKTIQEELSRNLVQGVENCIIALFDELLARYSWDSDLPNNIHYYNGWKTNCAWKINRRVIIPLNVYDTNSGGYTFLWIDRAISKLSDIEKALNYLDNGETGDVDIDATMRAAEKAHDLKNIPLKYFTATLYKKGTCHLTFTNERLLKKLNIFGSQKKGWLPKGYARRKYEEMSAEEQSVIESFEGRESYNASLIESEYYLFDA
ncbi:MAG: DUF4942 domain-containing protein, partial [Synergistaceae bacterium]|nr:DUF4942 domain-containing protein [Synergistaceae bacterium]